MLKRIGNAMRTAFDTSAIRNAADQARILASCMPNARPGLAEALDRGRTMPVAAADALAMRAAARAPYRAPHAAPVQVDRFVVAGEHPAPALMVLARAGLVERAHEVFGVYPSPVVLQPLAVVGGMDGVAPVPGGAPVPDGARFGAGGFGGSLPLGPIQLPWMEWTVVHCSGPWVTAALADAAAAVAREGVPGFPGTVELADLRRDERWFDRPRTEPLPWDEDAAAFLLNGAGVDPARCLGVFRVLEWGVFGPPGTRSAMVDAVGVRVLGQAGCGIAVGRSGLAGAAPVRFPADQDLAVRVDVLDAVPMAFAPPRPWTDPPLVQTEHPRLPADAEELLVSYLEIVGVLPIDCYGVSATVVEQQSGQVHVPAGDRAGAASMVSVVVRDRDEYEHGRERFEQWLEQQVQLDLRVMRKGVDGIERWGLRAVKLNAFHQLGLGDYRKLDMGRGIDAQTYFYCAGRRPSP